jgi:hypothetical protein
MKIVLPTCVSDNHLYGMSGESEELEMLIEDYKKSSLNNKNNKK